MANLLEQAAGWLHGQRGQHMSSPVLYCRGEQSVEVAATVGQTVFRIDDGYGAEVRLVQRDFLIQAADLVLNGQPTLPQRGDRIKETAGGVVHAHEVMGPGGNEPDWRYSDPYRTTFRIHTKEVGTEV